MSVVKINTYVDTAVDTVETGLNKAMAIVNAYDNYNGESIEGDVITKLYYILPILGKILVVVNDEDRDTLGVTDNVLANTDISNYPLVKLPSQILEYKELIIKIGTVMSEQDILNAAQAIADSSSVSLLPYKIPIVKVINYNDVLPSTLILPSVFGDNKFLSTDSTLINNGDSTAGGVVLDGGSQDNSFISTDAIAIYDFNGDLNDVNGVYNCTGTDITYDAGKFGDSGVCNGSSSFISQPDLDGTDISMSLWINFTALPLWSHVLTLKSPSGTQINLVTEQDKLGLYIGNETVGNPINYSLSVGNWINIIVTNGKLYVDGVEKPIISTGNRYAFGTTVNGLTLGKSPNYGSYFLNAKIDKMSIFNRVLTDSEIQSLANQ